MRQKGYMVVIMKKLLISQPWPTWMVTDYDYYCGILEKRGFDITLHPKQISLTEEELIEALDGVCVHVCGNDAYTRRVFEHPNAKSLRMLSKFGVGIETLDIAAATEHGVFVANTPGAGAETVAEFTLTLLLSMARRLPENERLLRSGQWGRSIGPSLYRQTLGIIGFGNIGQQLAKIISGFDMHIIAYDPYPNEEAARRLGVTFVSFEELIKTSDFVTLHLPELPENKDMMNYEVFRQMKKTAILVNSSRGGMLNEIDLARALNEGEIAGAALDVYKQEPINPDNPLLLSKNCILTAHNAGTSFGGRNSLMKACTENVCHVMDGILPKGARNPEVFNGGKISLDLL